MGFNVKELERIIDERLAYAVCEVSCSNGEIREYWQGKRDSLRDVLRSIKDLEPIFFGDLDIGEKFKLRLTSGVVYVKTSDNDAICIISRDNVNGQVFEGRSYKMAAHFQVARATVEERK
jgi:hypothetical protein